MYLCVCVYLCAYVYVCLCSVSGVSVCVHVWVSDNACVTVILATEVQYNITQAYDNVYCIAEGDISRNSHTLCD